MPAEATAARPGRRRPASDGNRKHYRRDVKGLPTVDAAPLRGFLTGLGVSNAELAARLHCDERRIRVVLSPNNERVGLDLVDRWTNALGRPDLLHELYGHVPIDLTRPGGTAPPAATSKRTMTSTSLRKTVLAELAAARNDEGRQLGLHAGALCSGCAGKATKPCRVCATQRQTIADMADGGRSIAAIARAVDLPVERVVTVLEQHEQLVDHDDVERQMDLELAASVPLDDLHPKSRNKLTRGSAIPSAVLRERLQAVMAAEGVTLSTLAARCGYRDYSQFARLIGAAEQSRTTRNGRSYGGGFQQTINVATAARICDALNIDPHSIPGL